MKLVDMDAQERKFERDCQKQSHRLAELEMNIRMIFGEDPGIKLTRHYTGSIYLESAAMRKSEEEGWLYDLFILRKRTGIFKKTICRVDTDGILCQIRVRREYLEHAKEVARAVSRLLKKDSRIEYGDKIY